MFPTEHMSTPIVEGDSLQTLSPADFWVGTVIGEGVMGRVLHCKHKGTNKHVAVKVVEKLVLNRPENLEAVLTEQRVLRQLQPMKSVVRLYASFHDTQCTYLVMECAAGTLTQLVRQSLAQPNWPTSARHYARQLWEALQEIHSQNIVHADLKPDNLLLTERGRIRLCDFGSSVNLSAMETPNSRPRGTSDYASPEVLRDETISLAVDLWSYGCVLYALMYGESPFHAETDALVVDKVCYFAQGNDDLVFPPHSFSEDWEKVVKCLVQPKPEARLLLNRSYASRGSLDECLFIWDDVDLEHDPELILRSPIWMRNDVYRDGSDGWIAFMI